jgi:hypothetical protein
MFENVVKMALEHGDWLSSEENSAECEIICDSRDVIFWLLDKILNHYNYTYCQKMSKTQFKMTQLNEKLCCCCLIFGNCNRVHQRRKSFLKKKCIFKA